MQPTALATLQLLAGHDTGGIKGVRAALPLHHSHLLIPAHAPTLALSSSKLATMSGCGSGSCSNGDGCHCSTGCGCCKTLAAPTLGGLCNYSVENDCKCGPNCNCADCGCHK